MIKQKSEDMQLDWNDPLTSPSSKRKNESALRQLQNDVMGKARSTLSSLGDVLKGSKNAPGSSAVSSPGSDPQYRTVSNNANSEETDHQFSTPPRSPKTPKDKSSLDFFPWSKNKAKDGSKNSKKEKNKPQSSQLSDVNEEDTEEDMKGNALSIHHYPNKMKVSATGAVKKKSAHDVIAPPIRYQAQGPQQRIKYSTDYAEETSDYRQDNEYSRSMEDGIQYISRDIVHSGEKYYDGRPKSYNEKYAQNYDYSYNTRGHTEYSEQYEDEASKNPKCIRKASNPSSPAPTKHILFNEENDILYYKDNQRPSKTKSLNDQHNREKQKIVPIKLSSAKDYRKALDSTPMPIRKVSKDEKSSLPSPASTPFSHGNVEQNIAKTSMRLQKSNVMVEDKVKINQKQMHMRPTLSRDYSIDYRHPSNSVNTDSNQYEDDSRVMRQTQYVGEDSGDKRSTKKICFQEPAYEDRTKCETLPRSRKNIRKNELDKNINEYLDTDMLRPRSGSLDSDLESQAMRIVRTVGQAFEVCHKLSMQDSGEIIDDHSEVSHCDYSEQDRGSDRVSDEGDMKKDNTMTIQEANRQMRPNHLELTSSSNVCSPQRTLVLQESENEEVLKKTPLTASREITTLKDQLDQQQLQTRQVLAQLMLVREQLISETNARIEAQARIQQLLQQNRELLEHIGSLGGYHEPDRPGISTTGIGLAPQNHQQALSDLLNLGGLSQHFPSIQHLNNANQPTMSSFQQTLNNASSGSYSTLNKLHNLNSNLQTPTNMMGSPVTSLTPQELYKLNQSILSQLTNSTYSHVYPTLSSSNLSSGQQQAGNFMFANQNATGFANAKAMAGENCNKSSPTNTGNISHIGMLLAQNEQQLSNKQSTSDRAMSKIDKTMDDLKQDGHSMSTESAQFIKPLSQVGTLTTMDADGKVKVIVPVNQNEQLDVPTFMSRKSTSFSELSGSASNEGSSKNISILKDSKEKKSSIPSLVTLKVTDESGTVTRRLPATPSFITRSTSEKVPNRSQIMSQVQRTQWARHTTK